MIGPRREEETGQQDVWYAAHSRLAESCDNASPIPQENPMEHRILLVEHDEEVSGLLCYTVKRFPDLDTVVCESPSQAAEAFERAQAEGYPFHMVFTESRFPHGSGFALARLLGAHVPVFVFVNDPEDIYEQCGTDLTRFGIRDLIARPFSPRRVRELVTMVTGKEMLPLNR